MRFLSKAKVKGYLLENWGAPFVLGFMALLIVAAACLAAGLAWWAEQVAVYAYYSLVVGVVLQLVCFWRHCGKGGEAAAS